MENHVRLKGDVSPEALATIEMIAHQLGPKHIFPGRSNEDMIQEGIYMGLRALPKYDGVRPLENWMRVVLKSRYLNYRRNNYQRSEKTTDPARAAVLAAHNKTRQNIMSPVDVDEVGHTITSDSRAHEDAAYAELVELIKAKLPVKLRSDYLKMIDGVHISVARKELVRENVSKIMEQYHGS